MGQSGRLQQRYIEALGLCAVTVMAPREAASPVRIAVSAALPAGDGDGDGVPAHSMWCAHTHQAIFVRGHCIGVLTARGVRMVRAWLHTDVATAIESLERAAAHLGIATASAETVAANAADAVARIEAAVEAMRVSGGLQEINRAYKVHRLEAERGGARAVTYPEFLGRYVDGLTALVAAGARQIPGGEFGALCGRHLPGLGVDWRRPEYIVTAADTESSAQKA